MKILRNSKKSVFSLDEQIAFSPKLTRSEKKLPVEQADDTVNLFEIYCDDLDNCTNYRLFFTINPVCSNVLFNALTEITHKEGSSSAKTLETTNLSVSELTLKDGFTPGNSSTSITKELALDDTEYNHEYLGGLEYHCGIDILDNHVLRSQNFTAIHKGSRGKKTFNTISSLKYGYNEKPVVYHKLSGNNGNTVSVNLHTYNTDNLMTFNESLNENIIEKDGWYGFYNKSIFSEKNIISTAAETVTGSGLLAKIRAMETKSKMDKISINKCINDDKSCGFIDFYPDRTLYSFLPKVNKYRDRIENNWDYCITYPYESVYNPDNSKTDFDLITKDYGIKIVWTNAKIKRISSKFNKRARENRKGTYTLNRNDNAYLFCRTAIKHNLKSGDYIDLFFGNDNATTLSSATVMVSSLGDENGLSPEYYFTLDYDTLSEIFGEYVLTEEGNVKNDFYSTVMLVPNKLFFKKCIEGIDCDYYFRRFKKIDGLKSALNKAGFSENVYGDKIAQIIFLDDIDVSSLKDEDGHYLVDNRGRNLSEIYLTIIKRNKGYWDWYYNKNYSSEDVEFSHCFGPVTDGLNIEYTETESKMEKDIEDSTLVVGPKLTDYLRDYNVHCEHNIVKDAIVHFNMKIPNPVKKLSPYFITIDDDTFLGDIVEYSPHDDLETTIEDVYFRFNTFQREFYHKNSYMCLYYHEIEYDDFDYKTMAEYCEATSNDFQVKKYSLLDTNKRANIFPEGYFYKPHYKIKLEEFDDDVSECYDTRINFQRKYYYSYTSRTYGDNQVCKLSFTGDSETNQYDATSFIFSGFVASNPEITIEVPNVKYDETTNSISASFEYQRDKLDKDYYDDLYKTFENHKPVDPILRHSAYTYGVLEETIFYCGTKSGYTEATSEEIADDSILKYYYSDRKGTFLQDNTCGTYVKYGPGEYLSAMTVYDYNLSLTAVDDIAVLTDNPVYFKMEETDDLNTERLFAIVRNPILPNTAFVSGKTAYYKYEPDIDMYTEIEESTAENMYNSNIISYYSDGNDYIEITSNDYAKYSFKAFVPVEQNICEEGEQYFIINNVNFIKIKITKNIEFFKYNFVFINQGDVTETFDIIKIDSDGIYINYDCSTKINFLENYYIIFVDIYDELFTYPKDNGLKYNTLYTTNFVFANMEYTDLYRYDEVSETYIKNVELSLYTYSEENGYEPISKNDLINTEETLYYKRGEDDYVECPVEALSTEEGYGNDYIYYEPNKDYYPITETYTPNEGLYTEEMELADFPQERYKYYNELVIETDTEYDYSTTTVISFLDTDENYYSSRVIEYKDGKLHCYAPDGIDSDNYYNITEAFIVNKEAPSWAYYVNDGSAKRIWRDFKKKSTLTDESNIYNRMFTNGAFYVNTDINFYLKRQDPLGIYGLQYDKRKNSIMANISITGKDADVSDTTYDNSNNDNKLCK